MQSIDAAKDALAEDDEASKMMFNCASVFSSFVSSPNNHNSKF